MPVSSIQYAQYPWSYSSYLTIKNDSTTPNTKFTISPGSGLDINQTYQLTVPSTLTVDATKNGANGLDTGSLAASTVYSVFIIGDVVNANTTAGLISASIYLPLIPDGYQTCKLIGYIVTDASSHFLKGYWGANGDSSRIFMYDAPQATSITAGNATSYTAIDLTTLVPSQATQYIPTAQVIGTWINSSFTPGAASRTLSMQPAGGTGDAITITGQVTSVPVTTQSYIYHTFVTTKPEISYKVSNSGDAAAINVAGFEFIL